jgi:hypothetical protein
MPVPVLSHELGHTLGLEDLYNQGDYPAEIAARAIGELDFMGSEYTLPQASIANKLCLGWLHPTWIDNFDFGKTPAGRPVTLQSVESLTRLGPPVRAEGRHRDPDYESFKPSVAGYIEFLPFKEECHGEDLSLLQQPHRDQERFVLWRAEVEM